MKFPIICLIAVISVMLLASCTTTTAPDGTKTSGPDAASVVTAGSVITAYLESRQPRVIREK